MNLGASGPPQLDPSPRRHTLVHVGGARTLIAAPMLKDNELVGDSEQHSYGGTCRMRSALSFHLERNTCQTISRIKARKIEAASAYLSRTKSSTGADKFNVSKERLSEAVKNVGHSAAAVKKN